MNYFNTTSVGYWQAIRQYFFTVLFIFVFGPFSLVDINHDTSALVSIMTAIFYLPALIIIILNFWEKDEYVSMIGIIFPVTMLLHITIGLSRETKDIWILAAIIILYLKPAFTARLRV